jgi:hypothetical protein
MSVAIGALNKLPLFRAALAEWHTVHRADWESAARFFKRNHWKLKAIRNDCGGHFSYDAARSALATIDPETAECFEFLPDWEQQSANMVFRFAAEIVAAALSRHRTMEQTTAAYMEELFDFLLESWGHAARAVHGVGGEILLPRFCG